jgi:hypothetical protein
LVLGAAWCICIWHRVAKKFRMRFSLRSLFIVMTFVAVIGGVTLLVRSFYYVQLRRVNTVLAEHPEICMVWLCTNDDVTLEIEEMYFSTVDQPEVTFGIDGIDGASKSEIRRRLEDALREKRPVTRPNYATQYRH